MQNIRLYSITSVLIVSLISLIGILTLGIKTKKLKKILIYLVSFSAGGLLGDAFIHLLPEIVEENGFTIWTSFFILSGILFGLITEKIIHRNHCHMPITKDHVHPFAYMNLIGDIVHNFIDGLIIGASYLVSLPVGIATTIAVLLHEIPQEIGDFGVLIHGGFSRKKALLVNFLTALTSIIGVIIALSLSSYGENLTKFLIPFAAGSFIYIAGSDLIPELHKETKLKQGLIQILFFLFGIGLMSLLIILE
ncbi:ZIP family metal transporter [Candidatus Gracilibacteria bacterium]|nr:ZIP family metal transporter [Candidatus Gracilibacteria bacterium]